MRRSWSRSACCCSVVRCAGLGGALPGRTRGQRCPRPPRRNRLGLTRGGYPGSRAVSARPARPVRAEQRASADDLVGRATDDKATRLVSLAVQGRQAAAQVLAQQLSHPIVLSAALEACGGRQREAGASPHLASAVGTRFGSRLTLDVRAQRTRSRAHGMASSRASTSRLSLDDWDQLAPLSAAQQHSANRVHHAALAPALPQHARPLTGNYKGCSTQSDCHYVPQLRQEAQAQAAASRPQTPLALSRSNSGSLDRLQLQETLPGTSTPSQRYAAKDVRGPSGGRDEDDGDELEALLAGRIDPVATTNQFHEWFSRVEGALDRDQESVYVDHLAQLARHLDRCRTVLDGLDEARGLASEIEANNRYVDENSAALQLACETLLDEQRHLVEVTEALSERLAYFRQLEKATRMLNLPGEHLVLNDDFLNLVDRLDACLEYLRSHGDFVDSEIYAIRFQQCLTRAMTLIKMYFVSTTRKVSNEAAAKMAGKVSRAQVGQPRKRVLKPHLDLQDLSETAQNALLYNKFSASAPTLRILLFELEKRAHSDPSEYASLLSECYSTWFAARSQLLSPLLAEEVRRMDPSSTDLVKLAKAGCGYLRGVCAIEWNLFREFFSSGQDEL